MVSLFYYNLYYKITKLEVKMPAYTSFIFDVYESYRVEKIVLHLLHHLIFLLSRLVSVYWFQTQFCMAKGCEIKFGNLVVYIEIWEYFHIDLPDTF